jgi:hypothetical protein
MRVIIMCMQVFRNGGPMNIMKRPTIEKNPYAFFKLGLQDIV